MSDAVTGFFSAWSEGDPDKRHELIKGAMASGFGYADPKTKGQIKELDALTDYVGEFGANAPGWTATVMKTETIAGFDRILIGFGDEGGIQMHGQYFAKTDGDGKIKRLIGFVGTGAPE